MAGKQQYQGEPQTAQTWRQLQTLLLTRNISRLVSRNSSSSSRGQHLKHAIWKLPAMKGRVRDPIATNTAAELFTVRQSTQKKGGAEDCHARVSTHLQQMPEKGGKSGSKTKWRIKSQDSKMVNRLDNKGNEDTLRHLLLKKKKGWWSLGLKPMPGNC